MKPLLQHARIPYWVYIGTNDFTGEDIFDLKHITGLRVNFSRPQTEAAGGE